MSWTRNLINWPPAKGPKPPHLQVINRRIESNGFTRKEFVFRQPPDAAFERMIMLDSIGDPEIEKLDVNVKVVHPTTCCKPYRSPEKAFILHHHVESVSGLTDSQARKLIQGWSSRRRQFEFELEPKPIIIDLTYPLSRGVRLRIKPYRYVLEYADETEESWDELTVGYVLLRVAEEYQRIYENHQHFKIWGHELRDLWFRRLRILGGGKAELSVGS